MDPDVALTEIRRLLISLESQTIPITPDIDPVTHQTITLVHRMTELDRWLSHGGFPPTPWNRANRFDITADCDCTSCTAIREFGPYQT